MNSTKILLLVAFVLGLTAVAEADAHGRNFRGHARSSVSVWFGVPGPFFYPSPYYYPRYYYPPAVVVPAPVSPPVYVERPSVDSVPSAESSTAYWYYCRDSQTYYPYVQQCASPWERVIPNSVPPS